MMGFNKEKVLKKAEALATKGKIDGAIKEFQKIVAKEGDDENILNRIGDLFKRLRKNDDAMKYWGKTADLYEHKGFYLKAIAVQKKIQRCDPGSLTSHRRLAELYHRQGLHNDARVHYQHLVDHYLRTNEGASAIGIYQKLIELEPENPTHRAKLAELYRQQQLTSKAIEEYVEIARLMLAHKEMDQALQVYTKALQIDPTDVSFLRGAVQSLKGAGGLHLAEQLMDKAVDFNPDAERLRSELLPSDVPLSDAGAHPAGVSSRLADPIPGANTGGFELIDTDQADAVDSGMQVIHSGSPTIDPGFDPPIHESVAPELPPIAPPSLTPPPLASPVPTASRSALDDSGGLEEFVIEFEEGPPDSLVAPPPDLIDSAAPGTALSGEYDLGVEITLDGVGMSTPQGGDGQELLLDEVSETGFELAPLASEGTRATPPPGAMEAAAVAASFSESSDDDDAFELDLDVDSGFDLSDGDLEDFDFEGPQVGAPGQSSEHVVPAGGALAQPVEPAPLAGSAMSRSDLGALREESDLLLPAEEFSAGMLGDGAADVMSEDNEGVLELHEMDLSIDDALAAAETALPAAEPAAFFMPAEPSPLVQRPAIEAQTPPIDYELPTMAEAASAAQLNVSQAEPLPAEAVAPAPPSFEPAPMELDAVEQMPLEQPPFEVTPVEVAPTASAIDSVGPASGSFDQVPAEPDPVESVIDSAGMPMIEDELQKVNDLLAEAEVFVKYGLQEKAVDRLSEVLRVDPRHLGAATQLIRLQLDRGKHVAVAPLFNGLYEEVQETGAMELWDELKESLTERGYVVENDQIVALPGGIGLDGQPLAGADIDVGDIFEEPVALAEEAVEGGMQVEAPGVQPEIVVTPVAASPAGGGMVDLGELGSEIDAEILAEFEGGSRVEAQGTAAEDPPAIADAAMAIDEVIEDLDPLAGIDGEIGRDGGALQPGLAWLNEPEATADEVAMAGSAENEVLFEDEEQFFDLAAELQSEMAPETAAETPVSPEEQSLEEIVEGFKKGVSENLSSEDYDTHYNLGIAYREMMLLDEAIGEFQIAAKSDDFLVDCCAMLGLCFREKGLPDLAMKWYQRALESGLITEDQTLGMLYEMGSVHLERQERDEAYRTFVEIYGMNTNYRDVASKMAELAPAGA